MTFSSIKYSALSQFDPGEVEMDEASGSNVQNQSEPIEYGMPEGTFDSAFTYARYNDIDKMGYEGPSRHGMIGGNKYSNFTYTRDYGIDSEENIRPLNAVETVIYCVSLAFIILTMPLSLLFSLKFVSNSEKLVVLRLGRAQKTRGPGICMIVPCIDSTHRVTTTITAFNVPPMQIITSDRGLVELGATVFLRIRDPIAAVCGVQDRNSSVRTLANSMLYRYISKKRICEITNSHERRIVSANLKDELGSFTCHFGTEITDVQFSDVKIIKEGENMGLAAINTVVKSDAGQQLWQVIGPTFEEIAKDYVQPKNEKLIDIEEGDEEKLKNEAEKEIDIDRIVNIANLAIDDHLTALIGKVFEIRCDDLDPILIDLKNGSGKAARESAKNPDVVFETSIAVFAKIVSKEISPITTYMNGSLKIKGNLKDAIQLKYLIERMSDWL